ncbi:MAG: hypothetical protein R3C12_00285 [Planctomycetaceae bacterium]
MNALRAQIGWKTATYYVALLVIAVGAGFLLDHLILPCYRRRSHRPACMSMLRTGSSPGWPGPA